MTLEDAADRREPDETPAPDRAGQPGPAPLPAALVFETKRGRGRRRAAMAALALIICGTVASAGVLVVRPALGPRLVQQAPASFVFPGTAAPLPWPGAGQAAMEFAGIGSLGSSGPATTKPVPIASVAKVLTAYQILRDHPLSPTAQGPELTVLPQEAAAFGEQEAHDESLIPVDPDEQLSERQALDALMLASADNIAQILARWDAGSVPAFLDRLNRTAETLGMKHSHYTDPSGLDAGTVSTAADQLRLAAAAMAVPAFAAIVGQHAATVPLAGSIHNFNRLLGTNGVVGVKTGSTAAAGGCLMFAAQIAVPGVPAMQSLYGVVLGQPGTPGTILPNALTAAARLVAAAEARLTTTTVVSAEHPVALLSRPLHSARTLYPAADVLVVGWPGLRYTLRVGGGADNPTLTVAQVGPGAANRVVSPLR